MRLNLNIEFRPTIYTYEGCKIYQSKGLPNPIFLAECRGEYLTSISLGDLKELIKLWKCGQ